MLKVKKLVFAVFRFLKQDKKINREEITEEKC
jgi:hypothetical protein